jgi:2-oxoacid:acceptor oxidoreductase gamma subunit (pyruvate/2-ketoisovalerate family)/2-oxoacid:acceptor oxidoreductase delta subunit (pyruvate/2-ketoisovalerate family)
MIELRLHGRGGQGVVTASMLLAEAFYYDGKYTQAIPMYGTERRGAPLTAFVRIDDMRVRERDLVHEPDIVVCLDPLISKRPGITAGLKKGGLLLLNYPNPPEEVPLTGDFKVATVDATKIALETLKRPITNTAILGAFSKVTGLLKLESIEKAILHNFHGRIGEMNVEAVRRSYKEVSKVAPLKHGEGPAPEEEPVETMGYGVLESVAGWRVFRPEIDLDKCTGCRTCWIYCPETAISWNEAENRPEIEYRKCKGCGICFNECPVGAIALEREVV